MQKIVLKEVVDYLHKVYPNASIGVGGSVALGTYGVDSDVDIIFQREDCRKVSCYLSIVMELRSVYLVLVKSCFLKMKGNIYWRSIACQ